MKFYFLAFGSILFTSCSKNSGQNSVKTTFSVRPEIELLVHKIAADNILKSAEVGYEGIRTDQWKRYEALKNKATNEELELLSSNSNSVVRCYAFQALANRKLNVFPILLLHLADTAQVKTFTGCVISSEKVGDYFIDVVTLNCIDHSCYKLTTRQHAILDSTLINDNSVKVSRKEELLAAIKPNPKFYQRIRQEAEKGNPQAVLALSRFQKKSDIDIINNLFSNTEQDNYYAIYSAREFSSPKFYPHLVKIFEKEWREEYYDYPKWRLGSV